MGDLEEKFADVVFCAEKIGFGFEEEGAGFDKGMTGVLFFKIFEIKGWKIMGVLGWGHGVAEVVVELEILGDGGARE